MPQHNWYQMGEWNACCDQCGRVFKSGKLMPRWDNAMVCRQCWEPRQPQDLIRGIPDNMSVPWSRPWNPIFVGSDTPPGSPLGEPYLGERALGS